MRKVSLFLDTLRQPVSDLLYSYTQSKIETVSYPQVYTDRCILIKFSPSLLLTRQIIVRVLQATWCVCIYPLPYVSIYCTQFLWITLMSGLHLLTPKSSSQHLCIIVAALLQYISVTTYHHHGVKFTEFKTNFMNKQTCINIECNIIISLQLVADFANYVS